MTIFIQSVIVIMILGAIVMLLLGINHLLSGNFDVRKDDVEELRKDIENSDHVISQKSSFHILVASNSPKRMRK